MDWAKYSFTRFVNQIIRGTWDLSERRTNTIWHNAVYMYFVNVQPAMGQMYGLNRPEGSEGVTLVPPSIWQLIFVFWSGPGVGWFAQLEVGGALMMYMYNPN